jgi:hypothetical protein
VVGFSFSGREQFNASPGAATENHLRKRWRVDKIGWTDNMRAPLCVFGSTAV